LISGGNYQLFGKNIFALPEVGLFSTFLVLGLIFLITITIGAMFLKNPEPGFKPEGWNPPVSSNAERSLKAEYSPSEMFRTWQFWLLWAVFLTGCASGLMVIMKASPIWQSFTLSSLISGIDKSHLNQIASAGALAVSILAIFNSLGSIVWGKISDLAGRKATLLTMFLLCGLTMLFFNTFKPYPLFLISISPVGLCFGGFLAVFPAVTADFFGTKHYGANYGWMFSAYGAGGLLGPYLAAGLMKTSAIVSIKEVTAGTESLKQSMVVGDYSRAFIVAGVLCLLAAVALIALRRPQARTEKNKKDKKPKKKTTRNLI